MGRKKSYKKEEPKPPPRVLAPDADGATSGDVTPGIRVVDVATEVVESASDTAPESAASQVPSGRPEWAAVAPARLEAAEEEAFWFAFALAVFACAPIAMSSCAALVAAGLAFRILRALWSVPSDVAPDDIGNARMMLFAVAATAAFYRAGGSGIVAAVWMFCTVFFFNSVHNVRTMVGLELRGKGKKKKKERAQVANEPPPEIAGNE